MRERGAAVGMGIDSRRLGFLDRHVTGGPTSMVELDDLVTDNHGGHGDAA